VGKSKSIEQGNTGARCSMGDVKKTAKNRPQGGVTKGGGRFKKEKKSKEKRGGLEGMGIAGKKGENGAKPGGTGYERQLRKKIGNIRFGIRIMKGDQSEKENTERGHLSGRPTRTPNMGGRDSNQ